MYLDRLVKQVQLQSYQTAARFESRFEVPTNYKHALEFCDDRIDNAIPSDAQLMDFGLGVHDKISDDKDDKNHASEIVFDHFNSDGEVNNNFNDGEIETIDTNNVIKTKVISFNRQTFDHYDYLRLHQQTTAKSFNRQAINHRSYSRWGDSKPNILSSIILHSRLHKRQQ